MAPPRTMGFAQRTARVTLGGPRWPPWHLTVGLLLAAALALGCSSTVVRAGTADAASRDAAAGDSGGPDAAGPDSGVTPDGAAPLDGGAPGTDAHPDGGGAEVIPGGGTILFQEPFDDDDFSARGWYDGPSGTISSVEHLPGSSGSFQCDFAPGATGCSGGAPARHPITPSESVYLSFSIKFSANWVGSQRAYHPHMLHFVSNADDHYVGFANTHLTTYTEVVWDGATGTGTALLALQDTLNVDLACVLRNDDSFVGCNGDFSTYPFTESRSVCACNGLLGDLEGRDCFAVSGGMWYSARYWSHAGAFTDAAGELYKNDWHFVEAYFEMNSVQGGIGVPDGKLRWVQDGQTLIALDHVLMRTGAHETLKLSQFAIAPYIGDGSPIAQSFWIDDLTVATARP